MRLLVAILLFTGIGISYTNIGINNELSHIPQRKTVDTICNAFGIVKNIGTQLKAMYIIQCQKSYINLLAANLSKPFMQDGLAVQFSGSLKEMHSMEDEYGQYFVVNAIEKSY